MTKQEIWVEAAVRARVEAELVEAGYNLRAFDEGAPPKSGVLLIGGAERAEAVARQLVKVAVIAIVEASELSYPSRAVAELVVATRSSGELDARIRRLLSLDAPGFRVHLLSRAVEFAGDIIEVGTTSAVLHYVNPAYEKVLGIPADEAEGKTPGQLVRSDYHPPEFFQALDRTLKEGKVWSGRIVSRSVWGELVYLFSRIAGCRASP
jgi:PAS domain-containing protein